MSAAPKVPTSRGGNDACRIEKMHKNGSAPQRPKWSRPGKIPRRPTVELSLRALERRMTEPPVDPCPHHRPRTTAEIRRLPHA